MLIKKAIRPPELTRKAGQKPAFSGWLVEPFSNQFMTDLDKIWELRYWVPDPTDPLTWRNA